MTAIRWLRGQSKSFRSYVACRVGEITTDFDPVKDIAYVPTDQNIADLISRGVTADRAMDVIKGPDYLRLPPSDWPHTPEVNIDHEDKELKKFHVQNAKVLAFNVTTPQPVIDPTTFSSWPRLIMVTADFERDIDFTDHHIMRHNPIFDEASQVHRVGGRVDKAPLSYDMRHPYLLPKKGHISLLITRERHRHALHGAHLRTVTEIRRTYWIVGDVRLAKAVIRVCKVYIRNRGKPPQQFMAELPNFRIKPFTPVFHTTLVDYLGPVFVKLNRNTTTKGYCAVFTCAVVRAVHLTCVQDLTTEAFLQALERFISFRGAPSLMLSDNATCFRGADKELRELGLKLDKDEIRSARLSIEWKFGPPDGPHHQGPVERIVQEVKRAMKVLVKTDKLTFVEWETVFAQISAVLNCRPLTAVSSSPLDDPPITPNHFLIGRGELPSPIVPCEPFAGNLRKRRQLCNEIVNNFWKRWITCIQKLSPRPKWSTEKENLEESDVVLVVDEKMKRGQWRMAEVINVYPGKDNHIRVVDVRFADGLVLKRPISRLILLMKASEREDITRNA
ncbi:uncharacterized protein LOC135497662 [Lineus longissimus]|uniref:uncharacterized protein LOC135497662 n=1 Tax=Lineus longissimus TaxID=88925 RepID=UPI00315C68FD